MKDNLNKQQLYLGVDIIEISRMEKAIQRWDDKFLSRIYGDDELFICRGRVAALAVRFAAKEAVMKTLGTGAVGVSWKEIEILANRRGKPLIRLSGKAKQRAVGLGMSHIEVSLSHCREYAVAVAAAQGYKGEILGE